MQVAAKKVPPVDHPPPVHAMCASVVTAEATVFLLSYQTAAVLTTIHPTSMYNAANVLLASHMETAVFIPLQHPPARSMLLVSEVLITPSDKFKLLVTNTSSCTLSLHANTPIAKVIVQPVSAILEAASLPLSDDI